MAPDELVKDNLECVFRSDPTDVITKAKHTSWLDKYANKYLIERDCTESRRRHAAAVVKGFYERNDSALFGKVVIGDEETRDWPKALKADDIRRVLKALSPGYRAPLLCEWQSGMEINRVLALRWRDVQGFDTAEGPLKVSFNGRKRHRLAYFTFLGKDAVEHLKLWRERWEELMGARPGPDDLIFLGKQQDGVKHGMDYYWINTTLKETAMNSPGRGW